jgi:hypothetical protein
MKNIILILATLLTISTQLHSRNIRYTADDSIKVVKMLKRLKPIRKSDTGKLLLEAGKLFLGTPYVGGTLDREKSEKLTVNISEVDCSTFVDQALALALTVGEGKCDFSTFCKNLEKVRYRNGICNGYESRLHYFSWWVADGEKRGIVRELSGKAFKESQKLDLGFMSRNPDKYMQLNSDKTFLLYQRSNSATFVKYSGTYSLDEANSIISGVYSDGVAWANDYRYSINEQGCLLLTNVNDATDVVTYEAAALPEAATTTSSRATVNDVRPF